MATAITELEVGEALISVLNEKGQPSIVERAFVMPPKSDFDLLTASQWQSLMASSPFASKYGQSIDRDSAYERLAEKVLNDQKQAQEQAQAKEREKQAKQEEKQSSRPVGRPRKTVVEKATDAFISTAVRTIGRELVRGLLGSLKKR
ncbi:helicase HerA-like domain-containing protein [Streptococcus iniae]